MQELIPAYCLGAVDPEERQWVEARLADCPEAAAELQAYQSLSSALLHAVDQVPPPPDLGARLMAAISAEAPAPRPEADGPPAADRGTLRHLDFRRQRLAWMLAAAMLALVVISNVYWLLRMQQFERERQQLSMQVQERENLIRALGGDVGGMGTGRVELADARSQEPSEGRYASLVWSRGATDETWIALLSAHNLPPLDPQMTYQLWLVRGDDRVSAGLFTVNADGNAQYLFNTDQPISAFEAIGVTSEPAGGSPAPTSPPVVLGQL